MSVYKGLVESVLKGEALDGGEWEKFRESYPNIFEMFKGVRDEEGRWTIGQASLIIYPEENQLKCCVSPKFFAKIYFTTIPDVLEPFQSLEAQLAKGAGEWKLRKAKR